MTAKMLEALRLLVEHGNGDISHDHPTALVHGTPTVNLRTALALDRLGYVSAFEEPSWQLWGGVELQSAGERAFEEAARG
jgi:hypothetical protein